ncbi:MAG: hypothetical protein SVN78_06145, partial [Deferribacterota bacterium]|nr:hypothetical protein [Deferribacterota bacterium]
VIMGISTALKEKMEFANGGAKTNNFYDYKILSAEEAPDIEVYVVETDNELGGVGEPGVPPAAPAVANAVFHATNIRLRNLPLTAEYFLKEKRKAQL